MKHRAIRIIHIDQNEEDRRRIAHILSTIPYVSYEGGFGTAEAAEEWLFDNKADIILLDIELPGKDGISLAKSISPAQSRIAFITAHPEYAVAAFELSAIHYLVKPVTTFQVQAVIDRLISTGCPGPAMPSFPMRSSQMQSLGMFVGKKERPCRIFLRSVNETLIVDVDNIMYFSAKRSCTEFEMASGERITASKNLKVYYEFLANNENFIRIHRSYVVNKNYIRALTQKGHYPQLIMTNGAVLEVSYFGKNDILETLEH